jgi:hypothetical protein
MFAFRRSHPLAFSQDFLNTKLIVSRHQVEGPGARASVLHVLIN